MNPKRICILASGGIDSGVLIAEALSQGHEVFPLYISCGFLWEEVEEFWLRKLLAHLEQSNLMGLKKLSLSLRDLFPDHWGFHSSGVPDRFSPDPEVKLPGRNLILVTQAALYCHSENLSEIWLGSLKGNPFPDAKKKFFAKFEEVLQEGLLHSIQIQTPFLDRRKDDLAGLYPNFPFHLTFSCLNPKGKEHCENCNKCEERRRFLAHADHATI